MGKFVQLELNVKNEHCDDETGDYSLTFDGQPRKVDNATLRFNVEVGAKIPELNTSELNYLRIHSVIDDDKTVTVSKDLILWVLYYSNFYAELSQALAAGSGEAGEKFADYFAGMYFSSVKPEDHEDTLKEILSDPRSFIKGLEVIKNTAEKAVVNNIVDGITH